MINRKEKSQATDTKKATIKLTKMMNSIDQWFFREQAADRLQLLKVGFGFILFLNFFWYLPNHDFFFAQESPFYEIYFKWDFLRNEILVYTIYALNLIFATLFMILWKKRWPGFALLLCHQFWVMNYTTAFFGWSQVIVFSIFHLSLIKPRQKNLGDKCSPDNNSESNNSGELVTSSWFVRILQFQVCSIYLVASHQRWGNEIWISGDQMNYFLQGNLSRIPGLSLTGFEPVLSILTYASWILEFIAPLFLMHPFTRTAAAIVMIIFHFGIEVFGLLGWWSAFMTVLLVGCFFPNRWIQRILHFKNRFLLISGLNLK